MGNFKEEGEEFEKYKREGKLGKEEEEGKSDEEEEGKTEGSPSSLGRATAEPTARIHHQPESGFPKPDNQTKPVSRVMMMIRYDNDDDDDDDDDDSSDTSSNFPKDSVKQNR